MTTKSGIGGDLRYLGGAARLVSPAPSPGDTRQTPILNASSNVNSTYGSGNVITNANTNNNQVTNYIFHGNVPNESDAVQIKISTILKSRHIVRAVYGAQIEKGCMKGTRVQVLLEIEAWIKDLKGPQIFWLAGMAGMGKSAIAWTVCERANDDPNVVLAGNFFCSRSTGLSEQRDVRCVVPTLAQLLALQSTKFAEALAVELTVNPGVLDQQVEMQVRTLLYKPLLALKDSPAPILFVIDALDECGGQLTDNGTLDDAETHRIVSDMLEALVTFSTSEVKLPVKFFVTSRPETHIRDTHVSDVAFSKVLRLHTVNKRQITADIRLYISNRLFATPTLRALFTEDDVDMLAGFCDDLFIVASTALDHTLSAGPDVATARFNSLINASGDHVTIGAVARLDHMYAVIVEDAARDDEFAINKLGTLLQILAALLSARMTLSVAALADLLDLPSGQLRARMTRLHAVIHVPDEDDDASLRPIHASFGDYLFGRASRRIRIAESLGHEVLTRGCFHVLEKRLHFNVSQSQSSFESNSPLKVSGVTLSLEYASLQWIYHVSAMLDASRKIGLRPRLISWVRRTSSTSLEAGISTTTNEMRRKVSKVIRPRLLFWLEVMSVLGQVQRAAAMLMFAAATFQTGEISRFLVDANSFVASSQEAIAQSAPHIYISALPFADKNSLVYQDFAPQYTGLISVEVIGLPHHAGQLVMTLTGHEDAVNSIAYSLDGLLLASGSSDGTVRIWDMRTGEEKITPLRSDDGAVFSVAFVPNGQCVISGTESGAVCVWRLVAAHVPAQRLTGHSAAVEAVVASPNGSRIASASQDNTVRLWNTGTYQQVSLLRRYTEAVHALAFSSDSLTLAAGFQDKTIQLWDVDKARPKSQSIQRHEQSIHSLCFLPGGRKLAVGCRNDLILSKPQTSKKGASLLSGSKPILSVGPSSDGLSLVSASGKSVYLSTLPRFLTKPSTVVLDGHTETVRSVKLSPNDLYIASASDDRTIRIWRASSKSEHPFVAGKDVTDNKAVSTLLMSDSRKLATIKRSAHTAAVSPDGRVIVSGSHEGILRVWDARTGTATLPPLLGHTQRVNSVEISSDGLLIASVSTDKTIRIWDAQTGEAVGEPLLGHTEEVNAVAFSPDARWLASGSKDMTVRMWELETRRTSTFGPFRCDYSVHRVTFSPNGRLIVAGDEGGYVSFWHSGSGRSARRTIKASTDPLHDICISPDSTHASCSQWWSKDCSESVRVWDISTGEQVRTLASSSAPFFLVRYSYDGRFIGGGSHATIYLWDAPTGALIAVLSTENTPRALAFTHNGRRILACSSEGRTRAWNLTESTRVHPTSKSSTAVMALNSATLEGEWLKGTSGELLLWVPQGYRSYLHYSRVKARDARISVKNDTWHRGGSWNECRLQDI